MKYAIYAAVGLLWISGTAGAQPTTLILDSVVLPESAVERSAFVPVSLGTRVRTHFEVLPELEVEKTLASDEGADKALQVGVGRAVAATSTVAQVQAALKWSPLPSGQQVAAINIQSTGAYGLRAGVLVDSLPDDALLRIYSQERPDAIIERQGAEVNALLAKNREAGEKDAAANTWWTPDVGSSDTTVEVVLPAGTRADALRISIPMVSHIFQNLSSLTEGEVAGIGPMRDPNVCSPDISCTSDYQMERNAVARMLFTRTDGNTGMCTGVLLNNSKGDYAPHFLTAERCIPTQSRASALQTDWFFRSSSCNSGMPGPDHVRRSAGATLLHASRESDMSLLKLNEMPPPGVTLAGWDALTPGKPFEPVYALHHPRNDLFGGTWPEGELLRYTESTIRSNYDPRDKTNYSVRLSKGTNANGSQGSPLFRDGRVIAALSVKFANCGSPDVPDRYGRFDKAFTDHFWNWLAN